MLVGNIQCGDLHSLVHIHSCILKRIADKDFGSQPLTYITSQHQLLCFGTASDVEGLGAKLLVTSSVDLTHYSACCSLEDPVNGQVELSNTTLGSTANYTCNQGYSLGNGSSTRTCEADGEWSGNPPSCERECSYLSP